MRPYEIMRDATLEAWVTRRPWPRTVADLHGLERLTRWQAERWGARLLSACLVGAPIEMRGTREVVPMAWTIEDDVRALEERWRRR